ncbi:MAG: spore coat associated protein CotJA [Oscillospiraceae bacterium]|nr:spore coat associated protein CotJA [Oscillospiraceae bacterium]
MYNLTENCAPAQRAGYAYVPEQRCEKLYPPEVAICEGTIFPELNLTIDEYTRGIYCGK